MEEKASEKRFLWVYVVYNPYNPFWLRCRRDFRKHSQVKASQPFLPLCRHVLPGNCAHYQKGGWWYNSCAHSNLNGVWYRGGHYRSRYQDGVYWAEFRGGAYSLKKVVMMIRPNPNTFH